MPSLPPSPVPPTPPAGRAHVVAQWAQALRNRADSAALQQLPPLTDAEIVLLTLPDAGLPARRLADHLARELEQVASGGRDDP